jgi:UDP-GlcNAc:undecaprenyl-phosphate/decaprenyl-phosphate GlcNAc-1-phosphate transferase
MLAQSTLPFWLPAICACLVSALALIFLIRLAPLTGPMDIPQGRKSHDQPTPLVGGIAIMAALLVTAVLLRFDISVLTLLVCSLLVFLAGVVDDFREISQYPRFAAQILACGLVLWLLNVPLRSVGDLFGVGPIGLWVFALPMTVFAVVGVTNATNMGDGMDGLAGSQALIAALAFATAAHLSGLAAQAQLMLSLAGALAAFLAFNLRLPWQRRARTFLGDAGSMSIGFLLGWTAVDLTQGTGRSLHPISALWVVVIPLCDTVSLILRRKAAGRSPMQPDMEHLHHQLLACGFSVTHTVMLISGAGLICSVIGVGGWLVGVPEPVLFALFVALFLGHHFQSKHFWRTRAREDSAFGSEPGRKALP